MQSLKTSFIATMIAIVAFPPLSIGDDTQPKLRTSCKVALYSIAATGALGFFSYVMDNRAKRLSNATYLVGTKMYRNSRATNLAERGRELMDEVREEMYQTGELVRKSESARELSEGAVQFSALTLLSTAGSATICLEGGIMAHAAVLDPQSALEEDENFRALAQTIGVGPAIEVNRILANGGNQSDVNRYLATLGSAEDDLLDFEEVDIAQ